MSQDALTVLSQEVAHVREALSRTLGTIYTLYGIMVPAVLAGLALFGKDSFGPQLTDLLGAALVIIIAGAIGFANSLYMEAFEYLRYMYGELFPRMYRLVGLSGEKNFFQFQAVVRRTSSWVPNWLFYAVIVVGTSVIGIGTIAQRLPEGGLRTWVLLFLALFSIAATLLSTLLTIKSGACLLEELKRSAAVTNDGG